MNPEDWLPGWPQNQITATGVPRLLARIHDSTMCTWQTTVSQTGLDSGRANYDCILRLEPPHVGEVYPTAAHMNKIIGVQACLTHTDLTSAHWDGWILAQLVDGRISRWWTMDFHLNRYLVIWWYSCSFCLCSHEIFGYMVIQLCFLPL